MYVLSIVSELTYWRERAEAELRQLGSALAHAAAVSTGRPVDSYRRPMAASDAGTWRKRAPPWNDKAERPSKVRIAALVAALPQLDGVVIAARKRSGPVGREHHRIDPTVAPKHRDDFGLRPFLCAHGSDKHQQCQKGSEECQAMPKQRSILLHMPFTRRGLRAPHHQ